MDFHAHLARTEVIGLLGGLFDPEHRRLHVRTVFPCNSLSTGLQCEMDPASEMAARDAFASYGDGFAASPRRGERGEKGRARRGG